MKEKITEITKHTKKQIRRFAMQRQIINPGPLLDSQGHLAETGYATSLLKAYDKSKVAANRLRIN